MAGLSLLILVCVAASVNSETETEMTQGDAKEITQDEKTECVKKFVEWCSNKQYPQEGTSALMSISYRDDDTNYYRVFCSSDSAGTNCSRNGSPWFVCAPDHVLTYKGQVLTETTADNDICDTQQRAFNELFVQTMSFDNSTVSAFERELKSFFSEILAMRQQIYELHKRVGDDFWGGMDDFSFENNETENPIAKEDTENDVAE